MNPDFTSVARMPNCVTSCARVSLMALTACFVAQ